MTKLNTTIFMVAVCACIAIPSPVLGSYMTYNGLGLNSQVRIHASGLLADDLKTAAGQLKVTYENTDYLAYCVDLDHYAGSAEVSLEDINTINNGDLVAWLYDAYAQSVINGIDAAALGVAIWEVLYETDATFDAGDGYFSITDNQDVLDQANILLGSVPSSYTPSNGWMLLQGDTVQGVVIPEPTTLGLLGVGAAGFLVKRHRRKG